MKSPARSHFPLSLAPEVNHEPEFGPYSQACSEMFPVCLGIHKQHAGLRCRFSLHIIGIVLYVFVVAMKTCHSDLPALAESNCLTATVSAHGATLP